MDLKWLDTLHCLEQFGKYISKGWYNDLNILYIYMYFNLIHGISWLQPAQFSLSHPGDDITDI